MKQYEAIQSTHIDCDFDNRNRFESRQSAPTVDSSLRDPIWFVSFFLKREEKFWLVRKTRVQLSRRQIHTWYSRRNIYLDSLRVSRDCVSRATSIDNIVNNTQPPSSDRSDLTPISRTCATRARATLTFEFVAKKWKESRRRVNRGEVATYVFSVKIVIIPYKIFASVRRST